jgi:dTDP-4-dehydrorhamnose reductase
MRVAILGAGGMLGHDLVATAPAEVTVVPFTHADLDITDAAAVERMLTEQRPEVVINAAAYTQVDKAEDEVELAHRVNAWALGMLGQAAARVGVRVVHFSTDYVFDGTAHTPYTEDTPTNPINQYGLSKLRGEEALRASGAEALIIRTQWLFGIHGRSFPRTMWERATAGQKTRVVNDQTGRPTYTPDLAVATWNLLSLRPAGCRKPNIVHVANEGVTTWYDLARVVYGAAGVRDLVSPIATADYPTPARRPAHSALDTGRFETQTGRCLPSWEHAIGRFLAQIGAT